MINRGGINFDMVVFGDVSGNSGGIGVGNTVTNNSALLDEQSVEMLNTYKKLSPLNKAKLLVYADELDKSNKGESKEIDKKKKPPRSEKMDDYRELRAEICKQKVLHDMTNKDLAKVTDLAESTINGFMGGKRYSEFVAGKLRKALNIPEHLSG